MPNYTQTFKISEVAHILEVDRQLIKDWSYHFTEYLSSSAKPDKGNVHYYNLSDIRVFAYVLMYWEEDPDIANIKHGLNSEDYYDNPFINKIISHISPLFRNFDDNERDDGWCSGVLIGGLAQLGDIFELAESYRLAGDKLVEKALADEIEYELICPILFTYRHSTELYLKSVLEKSKKVEHHDLDKLYNKFKKLIKNEFKETPPSWFENIILVFHDFDEKGTTFRYGGEIDKEEIIVDLKHVKIKMEWLSKIFQRINNHKKGIYTL